MNEQELKKQFKNTFNTVASGYDNPSMRFFSESARHISSCLKLRGDEHVLDVATGTGIAALTIAKDLPNGQVTGIDFSHGMLSQATKKRDEKEINNVTFVPMDMQAIEFPDKHFDIAISAFSIFFVEDMAKQLKHIVRKVKNDGKIIITTFHINAFKPLIDLFLSRLSLYGIEAPSLAWKHLATEEQCVSLFNSVGLKNIKSVKKDLGYYLSNASEWWYIVLNAGLRGMVNQLNASDLKKFQKEHLAEIEELTSPKGIWLEMNILYTFGVK